MKIPFFQVDAFSSKVFGREFCSRLYINFMEGDGSSPKNAAENNLSETAFLVPTGQGNYELRWFTPTTEIDLCGHATLASAFILIRTLRSGQIRHKIPNRKWGIAGRKIRGLAVHEFSVPAAC
ncbi:PhzF family phenazine biosynthesis protein [Dissulfurirhabdus thermomarina]|uniref:PhzF family phenazine biosynthesis protein n=1 Tax=Dissulfurirhabdus thermomarina TaxID=1765737 RepID=UPI001FE5628A|nr:PhzF family phenazine biosynthesis protein [Dissulfurirhabdus thermomarina]